MEDKKLTEKESMELIAAMIANTKQRLAKGEGNMLLFWGYLCVAVALLNDILSYLHFVVGMNIPISGKMILWLIPVIGIPYTLIRNKKISEKRNVLTYTDKLTISLWKYVFGLAVATIILDAVFIIAGLSIWYVMSVFIFFVIGMAISVQGMIIKERSLVFGGAFGVLFGGFIVVGTLIGTYWLQTCSGILLLIASIGMMIIPGHILNHKAAKE